MGASTAEQITHAPVAVVTGASTGFGKEIYSRLISQNWTVVGIARHEDPLAALQEEVGGEYEVCDITDEDQVRATTGRILGQHPSISLLVNNAGMPLRGDFEHTTDDDALRAMETNYYGQHRFTRALRPGLVSAAPSDVINMVSAGGTIANPHSAAYGASKHAQLALSRFQAIALRRYGIRVHAVLPGKAHTEGHPQKPSNSPISKLTRTDVDTVATVVMDRIGRRPREVYVPRKLKAVAVANAIAPVTTGKIVDRFIS